MNDELLRCKVRNHKLFSWALVVLVLFGLVKTVHEWQQYHDDTYNIFAPTIDVTGTGEQFANPDVAEFTFSIDAKGKTVAEVQQIIAKTGSAAITFLKNSGIAEKDIKTENYSFNPEYEYRQDSQRPCLQNLCPPVGGHQVLVGYSANETVRVKVRQTDKAAVLVDGLGKQGVTSLSGISFTIDNPDDLKAKARALAIQDAQNKANVLAANLHMHIVRMISYSENSGGYQPMYYGKTIDSVGPTEISTPPSLPQGENKITSNVTITYAIR